MITDTLKDMSIGMKVFTAIDNWDSAGFWLRLKVWFLAEREIITHLGFGHKIGWFDGVPYHLDTWEV